MNGLLVTAWLMLYNGPIIPYDSMDKCQAAVNYLTFHNVRDYNAVCIPGNNQETGQLLLKKK